jgi:uncharacterized membrane protein
MEEVHDAHAVAVFERHEDADAAIRELHSSGFDMKKLSIIGRDPHTEEHAIGFYNAGERARYWGKLGAFWGTIVGILFAPAFFWIPGVGFIMTGGLIGSLLMGVLEGAVVGATVGGGGSALAGALTRMGIPKDNVIHYEQSIKADKFVLIAHGSRIDVERSRAILDRAGVSDVLIHEGSEAPTSQR